LQVGDRAAGHLHRRGKPGDLAAEQVRHAAAERVVDAASGAGGDREGLLGACGTADKWHYSPYGKRRTA